MRRFIASALALAAVASAAAPAQADTRFLAYNASDRITQALTKGVTLEVRRGLFGAVQVERLYSTSARGTATTDTYSLSGLATAIDKLAATCP